MNTSHSNEFDRETAVSRVEDDRWSGHVSRSWNIGDNPNGGYLVAIALNALGQALPHPDPMSVTTHFLRPGVAEADCQVKIDIIRSGRTLSTARATLVQEGKARLEVLGAFADLKRPAGRTDAAITLEAPAMPSPEHCVPRSGETQGVHLPILERLDARLHPDQALAGQAGKAEVSGWIRFKDGRDPDGRALLLFADAFPPSPLGLLSRLGWVPTIELTVHVRRRPAPGWIQTRFITEDLHEGRMIESGALWDSRGELVAQSRQIGLIMDRD